MQHQKLSLHQELLLEAQELSGTGSFIINFSDPSKNVYTPEYKRIFEIEDLTTFDNFFEFVHPEDRELVKEQAMEGYRSGGRFEMRYRYNKSGTEKTIHSKGFIVSKDGRPLIIRGIVREVTISV